VLKKIIVPNLLYCSNFFTVTSRRGGGQSEVAVHTNAVGANDNNCGHMWERA
jgi:hypothetical protein